MDSNPSWMNCGQFGENQLDQNSMGFDELSEYLMLDYRVDDYQDSSSLMSMISPETCHGTAAGCGSSSATSRNSSTNMQVEYIPFQFLNFTWKIKLDVL